jgi:hypothetical protein
LPAERLELIRKLLPPMGQRPVVPGWLAEGTPSQMRLDLPDGRVWLALFNWDDKPRDLLLAPPHFDLPEGRYEGVEIWSGENIRFDDEWVFPAAPAHSCKWIEFSNMEQNRLAKETPPNLQNIFR